MHMLVLIRHAVAEDRETWRGGDDALRPLTDAGRRQAQRIARVVAEILDEHTPAADDDDHGDARKSGVARRIVSLRSSPATRCVDTVAPLAERTGLDIDIDSRLMEGCEIQPPSPGAHGAHVICAHGDNIPWLLESLKIDWDGRCRKGSIWTIERDARGRTLNAQYFTVKKG